MNTARVQNVLAPTQEKLKLRLVSYQNLMMIFVEALEREEVDDILPIATLKISSQLAENAQPLLIPWIVQQIANGKVSNLRAVERILSLDASEVNKRLGIMDLIKTP